MHFLMTLNPKPAPLRRRKHSSMHCQRRGKSVLLILRRAESAGKKDDQANQQNQANSAAADHRASKVKPAAAAQ
jgi:hypothetical protein